MSQSTIWTQLAAPKSSIGVVPFVGADGITIDIDPGYLNYNPEDGQPNPGQNICPAQLSVGGGFRVGYQSFIGAPAASYILNQPMGTVIIPGGSATITITNNCVFTASRIFLQLEGFDATLQRAIVQAHGNGGFVIQGNAAATGPLAISFLVMNPYLPA